MYLKYMLQYIHCETDNKAVEMQYPEMHFFFKEYKGINLK